jgi:hypothetical protein
MTYTKQHQPITGEQWDDEKLRRFIDHFSLLYKDVANAIGVNTSYVGHLVSGDRPIKGYSLPLTAYKNALIKSKVAEARAFCESMVEYFEGF